MGLLIGFLAVLLVLFLIFAMAVAEWTDRDVVDLMSSWLGIKPKAAASPAAAVSAAAVAAPASGPAVSKRTGRKPARSRTKPAARKKSRGTRRS
ncbi:MAG: hypothetical protein AB1439_11925 [candidate division FCPU426 bacterium]